MSQKLTKFEYEYQKESIEQDIRGLDISILEVKRDIKSNQLEAATWDLETSKEGIRKAKLGYESARTANDITEQKNEQLQDQLSYERAMKLLNKQSLLTAGQSALLALQQAQKDLEDNASLFELKYRQVPDLSALPTE
ncbi:MULTISPECIES: hypothetical protein [Aerosakkonema]|uniref:hypothetical protein n=1 Tax=Aerosakkonema TaxID=1246629 RepID=UPI0035BADA3A